MTEHPEENGRVVHPDHVHEAVELGFQKQFEAWICPICSENNFPNVMDPCGHSVCENCSSDLKSCPECRANIFGKIANFELASYGKTKQKEIKVKDMEGELEEISIKRTRARKNRVNRIMKDLIKNIKNKCKSIFKIDISRTKAKKINKLPKYTRRYIGDGDGYHTNNIKNKTIQLLLESMKKLDCEAAYVNGKTTESNGYYIIIH